METEAERLFAKYALQSASNPSQQGQAMLELDRIRLGISAERALELITGLMSTFQPVIEAELLPSSRRFDGAIETVDIYSHASTGVLP